MSKAALCKITKHAKGFGSVTGLIAFAGLSENGGLDSEVPIGSRDSCRARELVASPSPFILVRVNTLSRSTLGMVVGLMMRNHPLRSH